MSQILFDVVAVNIQTSEERLMAANHGEADAEIVRRSIALCRGVGVEIFKTAPAGTPLKTGREGAK